MYRRTHFLPLDKTVHSTSETTDTMTKGDKVIPHQGNGTR